MSKNENGTIWCFYMEMSRELVIIIHLQLIHGCCCCSISSSYDFQRENGQILVGCVRVWVFCGGNSSDFIYWALRYSWHFLDDKCITHAQLETNAYKQNLHTTCVWDTIRLYLFFVQKLEQKTCIYLFWTICRSMESQHQHKNVLIDAILLPKQLQYSCTCC